MLKSKFIRAGIGLYIILFLSGCSHTMSVQNYNSSEEYISRINRECKNESVVVELTTGDTIEAEFDNITNDTLKLIYEDSPYIIPSKDVYKLVYNSASGGMMRGLAIGTAAGVATGLLISTSDEQGAGWGAIFLMPVEAITCAIIGSIRGDERTFLINDSYKKTK